MDLEPGYVVLYDLNMAAEQNDPRLMIVVGTVIFVLGAWRLYRFIRPAPLPTGGVEERSGSDLGFGVLAVTMGILWIAFYFPTVESHEALLAEWEAGECVRSRGYAREVQDTARTNDHTFRLNGMLFERVPLLRGASMKEGDAIIVVHCGRVTQYRGGRVVRVEGKSGP